MRILRFVLSVAGAFMIIGDLPILLAAGPAPDIARLHAGARLALGGALIFMVASALMLSGLKRSHPEITTYVVVMVTISLIGGTAITMLMSLTALATSSSSVDLERLHSGGASIAIVCLAFGVIAGLLFRILRQTPTIRNNIPLHPGASDDS
jgi:hypothetical protein